MTNQYFPSLEKNIEIQFSSKKLLHKAFIHRSYLNENKKLSLESNEKLEFLGDSVLSLIASLYLFNKFPKLNEGDYTNIKASLVKTESLAFAARELDLGQFLFLSKGEEDNGGRTNTSLLADCFEALIGAIFLDKNFESAYNFVAEHLFGTKVNHLVANKLYNSAKNRLQEYSQGKFKKLPEYTVIHESGPEHKKKYTMGVVLNKKLIARGEGKTKKQAEEQAALRTLQSLGI